VRYNIVITVIIMVQTQHSLFLCWVTQLAGAELIRYQAAHAVGLRRGCSVLGVPKQWYSTMQLATLLRVNC
jgi:hypothetical protein